MTHLETDFALKPADAAVYLGVSTGLIYNMLNDGRLTKYEDDFGKLFCDKRELDELIKPKKVED